MRYSEALKRVLIVAVIFSAIGVAANGIDRAAAAPADLSAEYKLTHSIVDQVNTEKFSVTADEKGKVELFFPFFSGGCIAINELKVQSVETGEGGVKTLNLVWRSDRGAPCKAFLRVKLKAGLELAKPGKYLIRLWGNENLTSGKIALLGEQEIVVKDQVTLEAAADEKDPDAVKKVCLAATINAIKLEMNRQQGQEIRARLQADLEKYQNMPVESYTLPEKVVEEAFVEGKAIDNGILHVPMMSRSGPWYHLSGIVGGDYDRMKPGVKYQVAYYKVYPRVYWHMPSSYVCVAEVQ